MATSGRSKFFTLTYFRSFVKFSIVGAIGVAVNEGLLILFYRSLGLYLLTASAAAIEISILSNFVLNDLWTFRDRRSGRAAVRLVKFNVLMLAGLVVNLAVLDAGTTYLGIQAEIANLLGIAAAFFLRYALSVRYAWMRVEAVEEGEATPALEPLAGPEKSGG
jgi:dolichol-phosphate mannosyltransferase